MMPLTLLAALLAAAPAAAPAGAARSPLAAHPLGCCAPAAQVPGQNQLTVEPVVEGCWRIHYAGSNCGVFMGPDGILLVDGGFLRAAPEIDGALQELWDGWWERHAAELTGPDGAPAEKPAVLPVRYVVVTHFHADHCATNPWYGAGGAQLIAHESVRRRLMGDETIGDPKVMSPPMDPVGWPVITFEDRLTLHFNGQPVSIRHVPDAHTDGDCVVWLPGSKVLFAGDVFNTMAFPFIELTVGARPSALIAAHEELLSWLPEDARLVPGHGVTTGVGGLREFADMFADCDRQIRARVAEGLSLQGAYDLRMFGEYMDRWAAGEWRRTKGFVQIMWYCYAPRSQRGLGVLDEEAAAAGGDGDGADGAGSGG